MRKTTIRASIAAVAASVCLLAADQPKTIRPEFATAGLKALITLRQPFESSRTDQRIQDALDNADANALSDAERDVKIKIDDLDLMHQVYNQKLQNSTLKPDLDKATAGMDAATYCRMEIEKVLHSGKIGAHLDLDVPHCDLQKLLKLVK
jgi:hypothetical protein